MIELYLRYTDGREYTETRKKGVVPPDVMLSALVDSARRAGNRTEQATWKETA